MCFILMQHDISWTAEEVLALTQFSGFPLATPESLKHWSLTPEEQKSFKNNNTTRKLEENCIGKDER